MNESMNFEWKKIRFKESKPFEDGETKKRAWGKTISPFKLIEEK